MTPTPSADAAVRWHRVPFMWLVVGLPALTVVAGLTTVAIAYSGRDAVVADDFRKEGLAINRDPRRDAAATSLGVEARVAHAGDRLQVALAPGRAAAPRELVIVLSHATRAEHDRMVTLSRTTDGDYAGAFAALPPGHWYLEVTPPNREWRLTGDFVDRVDALLLRPAPAG